MNRIGIVGDNWIWALFSFAVNDRLSMYVVWRGSLGDIGEGVDGVSIRLRFGGFGDPCCII